MTVLVIQHHQDEGPGTLGNILRAIPAQIHTAALYRGQGLPREPGRFRAVVTMGGPMNVYEEESYPFLREETDFLRRAVEEDIAVLGICLGAQMIAKACGARVTRAPKEEVGWGRVRLTGAGSRDPLFSGLPGELEVFQWHGDTFDLPDGGELLATSGECPYQAFRFRNAYGLQFHVEVTGPMLLEWFGNSERWPYILSRYLVVKDLLHRQAGKVLANFLSLAGVVQGAGVR